MGAIYSFGYGVLMMKLVYKILIASALIMLLSGCGDDLSSLPDPQQKAPGKEPDSFTFETATDIDLSSIILNASIYSSVPASTTRYYQFTLEYFDTGRQETMTLNSSDAVPATGLTLSWYGPEQDLKTTSATSLDFSSIEDDYYLVCCEEVNTFYISIENTTSAEVNYQIGFN